MLAGGGARGAYQVGVLQAIADLLPANARNPFPIIAGTSAGAINAAVVAIYATAYQEGIRRLNEAWANFHVGRIFRADAFSTAKGALHWFTALIVGGLGRYNPPSLLDNTPLRKLLEGLVPCERIQHAIDKGALHAVCVTASGYSSGESVSFFQGVESVQPWRRARRVGSAAKITIDHLMASSALPMIFPAIKVSREYFGDGSMRQTAPLSPALHLGADRLLVIGVRREKTISLAREDLVVNCPSFGEIAGYILDTLFLDSLYADVERLQRINRTISLIPNRRMRKGEVRLRPVDVFIISPSQNIGEIAEKHRHHFPRPVRHLLRGVGALSPGGRGLMSYLLFEQPYCRELIELGYVDTMRQKEKVLEFLG